MIERMPEKVLFDFLLAVLRGRERELRPLILDHSHAALLWRMTYPPDVAEQLARRYEGMAIDRVESGPDRVVLRCQAGPTPFTLVNAGGQWRVDASRIIENRRRALRRD